MVNPDSRGRIDGTTYPSDRAPAGSSAIGARGLRLREALAGLLLGASVRLLRPEPGDVLVVRGRSRVGPDLRQELNERMHQACGGVAVFLPTTCRVHLEPRRLRSEDRGYRETKSYGRDQVFTGLPEEG